METTLPLTGRQNVLSTSFRRTVYITTCLRMILSLKVICPVTITCIQSTLTRPKAATPWGTCPPPLLKCFRRHWTRLSCCINDLTALFSSLWLQLNPTKSEFIWFGSRHSLAKIPPNLRVLSICGSAIDSAHVVHDLAVWFDSELTMKHHK